MKPPLSTALAIGTLASLAFAGPAAAQLQTPFGPRGTVSFELRGGLAAPTEAFSRGNLGIAPEPGVIVGGDVMLDLTRRITAYAGYSWARFDCAGDFCGGASHFTSSGLAGGFKFTLPLDGTVLPWIRGGALLHQLRFSNDTLSANSSRPLGFEAGAGVNITLGRNAAMTPALRYNRYGTDIDLGPLGQVARTVSFGHLDLAFNVFL